MKDHPDREVLLADLPRLYAAMATLSLERLSDCVEALHARLDLLRKAPRKSAAPVVKRGMRRNGDGRAGAGGGA